MASTTNPVSKTDPDLIAWIESLTKEELARDLKVALNALTTNQNQMDISFPKSRNYAPLQPGSDNPDAERYQRAKTAYEKNETLVQLFTAALNRIS